MALTDGNGVIVDRTRNALLFSQGANPPAVGYIPDPSLPRLFEYKYGGSGYVVIPKGRIVAVNNGVSIKSPETGKSVNPMTIANGVHVPLGVASTNVYELNYEAPFDMVYGILTNDTIEIPVVRTKADADAFAWACGYGTFTAGTRVKPDAIGHFVPWNKNVAKTTSVEVVAQADQAVGIELDEPLLRGSQVTVTEGENPVAVSSVKYSTGTITIAANVLSAGAHTLVVAYTSASSDPVEQIVGTVYEVDTNIPPEGWLKWAELPKVGDLTDPALPIGWTSQDRINNGGYFWDPLYKDGFRTWPPRGINGLTNGYFIEVEYADEVLGIIPKTFDAAGKLYTFRLKHTPVVDGSVTVAIQGVPVAAGNVSVDLASGLVRLTVPADWQHPQQGGVDIDATVTATYTATGQIPGVPSGWDVKGLIGVARIKLTL